MRDQLFETIFSVDDYWQRFIRARRRVIEKTELDTIAKTTMAGLTVSHRPSPVLKAEVLAPVSLSSMKLKGG
jgi:hypothetical protein